MNEMITNEVSNTAEGLNNNVSDVEVNSIDEPIVSIDTEVSANTANLSRVEQNSKSKSNMEITEDDFRWYCVKTNNSFEARVKKAIDAEVKRLSLGYCIREVVIPMETVFETRSGKKKTKLRNFLAGYVLVNAAISEQKKTKKKIIDVVTEISGVVSFVGRRNEPAALQPAEVERIFNRINERTEVATIDTTYRKGDPVGVLVGPFAGFKGTVLEVFNDKQKIKVEITILGRKTPIELSLEQIQFDKPE